MDQSRRDFLKKSAIVGGAAWVAPSIITVSSASAASPSCNCASCSAQGTGVALFPGEALPLGQATSSTGSACASSCLVPASPLVAVACGKADSGSCSASAFVAGVGPLDLGGLGTLSATLISTCVCCGRGGTTFADVSFTPVTGGTPLTLTPNCNGAVGVVPGLLTIFTNEQTCTNGVLTVNGLRVNLGGSDIVILAQSKAGATGCACHACTTGSVSTPPCTTPGPAQTSCSPATSC